jgi:hypothetical protein
MPKPLILEAVTEAKGANAAKYLAALKKAGTNKRRYGPHVRVAESHSCTLAMSAWAGCDFPSRNPAIVA